MLPPFLLQSLLLSIPFIPNTSAQSGYDTVIDPTKRAGYALSTLQIWYNAGSGIWDTAGWWNSANIMTMVGNLAKADPENKILQDLAMRIFANTAMQGPSKNPQPGIENEVATKDVDSKDINSKDIDSGRAKFTLFNETGLRSGYTKSLDPKTNEPIAIFPADWHNSAGAYIDIQSLPIHASTSKGSDTQIALATPPDPEDWLDGFYDDDLWWALAWINAYDITRNLQYLHLAEGIFAAVTKVWPTNCGNGGIYWSWEKDYTNAIANELFLSTAAHLANRVEEQKEAYTEWAERTLEWFLGTGMINDGGTINDGLNEKCENNGKTTWSYNQGVILGGLVELNRAAPNASHITLASRIAKAAIKKLSDENGVIHDGCEPNCGGDGAQFKGVFMRNLRMLHEAAPDTVYADAIRTNADSVWNNDRDDEMGIVFSVDWAGPFARPANASTHSSAMDALVAAIAVK